MKKYYLLFCRVVKIFICVAAKVAQDPPSTSKFAPRFVVLGKNVYQLIPLCQSAVRTNDPAVFC